MNSSDVIRAWKDPEYRMGLSAAEQALLPANPAGVMDLTDAQLDQIAGGFFGSIVDAIRSYFVAVKSAVNLGAEIGDWAACQVHGDQLLPQQCPNN